MSIVERRKKSIRNRLTIDFGIILIGICVFNYLLVSYIYKDRLYRQEQDKTDIVANAAITQTELIIQDSRNIISNISRIKFLKDYEQSVKEKTDKLEDYVSLFFDIGIVGVDGQGISVGGESFNVAGNHLFEDALQGKYNTFDLRRYEGEYYLVFLSPIKGEDENIQAVMIGVRRAEDFFDQIMQVSSGQLCFLGNRSGDGVVVTKGSSDINTVELLTDNEGIKNIFEKDLLFGKEYNYSIANEYTNTVFNFNYEMIGDSEWLIGVVNTKGKIDVGLKTFNIAMLIGMITAIVIGLIIVYLIASSIAKRMQHIVSHLEETIKSEFKESVPTELLENEDEIGSIAREMKHLEDKMAEMLISIKESINYLNDRLSSVSQEKEKRDDEALS